MLFSPVNQATTPPSFGIVSAISARALAALAAADTFSAFIPCADDEKSANAFPNGAS